jgi:hypothetical protein
MVMDESRLRAALREIARIAGEVTQDGGQDRSEDGSAGPDATDYGAGCRIMALPARLQDKAAEVAARVNPVNAPLQELLSSDTAVDQPLRLTLTTAKYWGPKPKTLSVSFLEPTGADLGARIVSHLNAWAQSCGITFALTSGTGDVRISRGPGGYYSYLGTDIKLIPANRQTMNLQGFTMNTPESEYRRVVRHEAGHTLGFPHEHMRRVLVERIDPEKAYAYFARTQGWSKQMVDQQVLTPLDARTIIGTEPDQDSIMCYQLPGEITRDGQPIRGGTDIIQSDAAFAGLIYPKVLRAAEAATAGTAARPPAPRSALATEDWDPSEDVIAVTP